MIHAHRRRPATVIAALGLALLSVLAVGPRATAAAADASWTAQSGAPDATAWREVAWAPALGLFVAVGNSGVMTSPDGIAWTPQTAPATAWNSVTWSPELAILVAVGNGAIGASTVMTSPDGVTWTTQTPATPQAMSDVTWSPEQSKFVAVAVGAASMTSPDGITWTASASLPQPAISHDVVWAAELGLYVAASDTPSGPSQRVFTSPDGSTWTQVTAVPAGLWRSVAYSTTVDLLVVVGVNGIMTSPDGATWTARTSPVTDLRAVTWSPEQDEFVALGSAGIVSSADGVTWTQIASPAANAWESVTWSAELSRYVGTSPSGTLRTLTGVVPTVAGAPIHLVATLVGDVAELAWSEPAFNGNAPVTGYRIERSANGGPFEVLVADTASTATTYGDADIAPGTTYTYRVIALNAEGASLPSNEASVSVPVVLAATGQGAGGALVLAVALLSLGLILVVRRRWRKRPVVG